jgi:lysozyme
VTTWLRRRIEAAEADFDRAFHGHSLTQLASPPALGEDRSSWQAIAPWTGWSFGFAKATEGTFLVDSSFIANWDNLAKAGIPRGAYCFFHPGESAIGQADLFYATVKNAGLKPGDMFVLDVEILSGAELGSGLLRRQASAATVEDLSLTPSELDLAVLTCLGRLRQLAGPGHPILVYTNHAVGQYLHETARFFPDLWFAWPGTERPTAAIIAPFTGWKFWQNAIVSGTDRDEFNGSAAALSKWIAGYNPAPVKEPPVPGIWKYPPNAYRTAAGFEATGIGTDGRVYVIATTGENPDGTYKWGESHAITSGPVVLAP